MKIQTTAQVGKSLSIKLTKGAEDTEVVVASLAFADATVSRDEADEILGVPIGWSERLYDELGAPAFRGSLDLGGLELDCTATIGLTQGRKLVIRGGSMLSRVSLELQPNTMLLAGTFTWETAGDESSDAEDLLGHLCTLTLVIERPQADLLAPLRGLQAAADRDGTTMTISTGAGEEIGTIAPQKGRITSASEVMMRLQAGDHLRGADPEYWIEKPDGTDKRGVWLNAAKSALKRGLDPIGSETDEVGRWKWRDAA